MLKRGMVRICHKLCPHPPQKSGGGAGIVDLKGRGRGGPHHLNPARSSGKQVINIEGEGSPDPLQNLGPPPGHVRQPGHQSLGGGGSQSN